MGNGANAITVLRNPSILLAKRWRNGDKIDSYKDAKQFKLTEHRVDGIHALSDLLTRLERDPHSCVIRGEYLGDGVATEEFPDEVKPGWVLRRKALFRDVGRAWVMIDADDYKTKRSNWQVDPVGAVREYIASELPPAFHETTFHWQLSASAGHPTKGSGLRVHVWFCLATPVTSASLLQWAKRDRINCDTSLFTEVQPHYTAAPVFDVGVSDPVAVRSGLAEGEFGHVVHLVVDCVGGGDSSALTKQARINDIRARDPVLALLGSRGMVKSNRPDGSVNVSCPRAEHHSTESAESSTIYFPAHTGGYSTGTFVCMHAHCRGVSQGEFLSALGVEVGADVFSSLERSVQMIRGDDITPMPIRWLWRDWLAAGKLILLAGSPGTGKTTLAMAFAAIVSRGVTWPDGERSAPGSVVIWSAEDDPNDTLAPRLLACDADMRRIKFVSHIEEDGNSRGFDPARDTRLLLDAIAPDGDCKLIIVDPIVSAVAGDSHKNAEVRRGLQPLVDLAAKLDAALIGITHYTKGTAGRDTTERVTGSIAFGALARIVLATARDTTDGGYLLTRAKSNIGPDGGGFRYVIEQTAIPQHAGISTTRVHWGEPLTGNARELIAEAEGEGNQKKESSVEEWLRLLLMGGPMPAKEVLRIGVELGHGERKLQRTLHKIGGRSERAGFPGESWWALEGDPIPVGGDLSESEL